MTNNPEQGTPPVLAESPAAQATGSQPAPPPAQPLQPAPPAIFSTGQYAQAGVPNTYTVPPAQPTNVLAIVSLVASIIGFALVGVITGHVALGQVKRTGAPGHGIALAGVIIGYVYIGASVLFLVVWGVIALVFAGTTAGTTSSTFN